MSSVAAFFLRPRVNLAGAAISAIAEVVSWFTTFDDAYQITPTAFVLSLVFLGLFALHEHIAAEQLRSDAQPRLRLAFDAKGQLYDSLHHDGRLRIFRVGVVNSGASVPDVAVKVARIEPQLPRVFPMQELQHTHAVEGISRFTVNKSDEPLVFVDVIHQYFHTDDGQTARTIGGVEEITPHRKGTTSRLWFTFGGGHREIPLDADHYLVWLVIDGAGAEKARKFVLRRQNGCYEFALAFT